MEDNKDFLKIFKKFTQSNASPLNENFINEKDEPTEEEEEFVLKQSDVDNYNEKDIRKSFSFSKTEEND